MATLRGELLVFDEKAREPRGRDEPAGVRGYRDRPAALTQSSPSPNRRTHSLGTSRLVARPPSAMSGRLAGRHPTATANSPDPTYDLRRSGRIIRATRLAGDPLMNWRDYIVSDPEILVGKPVVKGTRLSVDLVLDRLADGWTAEDLVRSYPRLTPEALQAVFAFTAEVLKDEDYVALAKATA